MLILDPHGNPVQATNPDGSPMTESVTETASLYTPEGYTLYLPYTTTLTGNCKLYQPTAWDEATSRITFTRVENNVVQAYKPYYVIVEEGEVSLNTSTATVIGVEPADNGVIHINGGSVSLDYLGNINNRFLQPSGDIKYTFGENQWIWEKVENKVIIDSWNAYFIADGINVDSFTMDFEDNTVINLEVTGHGDSENSGWVFISSPVAGSIEPSEVENLEGWMVQNGPYNYDLYRFNQSADLEWENYHGHDTEQDPFMLVNGQGYLYATKETKTLVFSGTFNTDATKDVTLQNGFNLIGNPFNVPAYVNRSYYKMNAAGSDIEAVNEYTTNTIPVCTGIVVKATANNETVRFSKEAPVAMSHNNGSLQMTLTRTDLRSNEVQDKAIVSFNEGAELGKFIFNENHAKLYIPQGSEDYAIVSVGRDGVHTVSTRMPVNFKAKENGQYTITVKPEGVEMSYLHLIDNMTGADVDLLALRPFDGPQGPQAQGPASYTFTAKTTDYASRFKLVFVANNVDGPSTGSGAFAFIDASGNIIITEDVSDAMLQVIDAMGRVLVSRDALNASPISTTGMTPGVYVLRLINGDDVKTQKIIIE